MAGRPKRCGFFARGDEYVFASLADFETALAGMSRCTVPGSLRIVE